MYRQYLRSLIANNESEIAKKHANNERLDRREQSILHREIKKKAAATTDTTDVNNSSKDTNSANSSEEK